MGDFYIDGNVSEFLIESSSINVIQIKNGITTFENPGEDYQAAAVIISGSIIPGNLETGSIGTSELPFKDMYIQSGSIHFADISRHNSKNWNEMDRTERNARTTRFGKAEVDTLYRGEPLQSDGILSASGHFHARGQSELRGATKIVGETTIEGNTTFTGYTDIRGIFKVAGSNVSNLAESLAYSDALRGTGVTNTEFDYLDGVTSAIQTQLDAKEATIGSSNRVDATEVGTGVVSNTEFNYVNGVTSAIQTQLNAKATTAGVVGDLLPDADGTRDLGSTSKEWQDLWIDGTANIDTALIGDASITNTKMTGQIHINPAPTAISANGILDARTQNHFTIANNDVTGIRGSGNKGQIVTIVALGAYRPLLHHAENGVHANDRFMFAANRDVSLRGPAAMQVIYAGTGVGWYRLL